MFVFCFESHLAPAEFCFLFFSFPILLLSWEILCDMRRLFVIEIDSRELRERERRQGCYPLELPCGICVWNLIGDCIDKRALPL